MTARESAPVTILIQQHVEKDQLIFSQTLT